MITFWALNDTFLIVRTYTENRFAEKANLQIRYFYCRIVINAESIKMLCELDPNINWLFSFVGLCSYLNTL